MRSGLPGGFGDVERGAEAGHAAGLLVLVGFEAFDGLEYEDGVHRLRERRVVGSGALHVDDAFLESDDAAAGEDGGAFEDEGLSASDGLNVAQHSGEYLAGAFGLVARFDNVFYRADADGFAGTGEVGVKRFEMLAVGCGGDELFFVDLKSAVGKERRLVAPSYVLDFCLLQFEFQNDPPCGVIDGMQRAQNSYLSTTSE